MFVMERRLGGFVSEIGYRETDKRRIDQNNMRYLTPQQSSDLFKVMAKINIEKKPITSLSKAELNILFYGHVFTNSVGLNGIKTLNEDEMKLYADVMADSFYRKYEDVEVYLYQYPRQLSPEESKAFSEKADKFKVILEKFEKIMGKRDKSL